MYRTKKRKRYLEPGGGIGIPLTTFRRHNLQLPAAAINNVEPQAAPELDSSTEDLGDTDTASSVESNCTDSGSSTDGESDNERNHSLNFSNGSISDSSGDGASETGNDAFSPNETSSSSSSSSSSDSGSHSSSSVATSDESEDEDPDLSKARCFSEKHRLDDRITLSSGMTKFEALMMVYHYQLRFGFSDVAVEALIDLINKTLGDGLIPATKHAFRRAFPPAPIISYHFFCPECSFYLGSNQDCSQCPDCKVNLNLSTCKDNFFVMFSVENQIKSRLEADCDGIINFRKERQSDPDFISDVFDGVFFSDLIALGLKDSDITISINTDGSPIFKSSNNSVWPIQFRLNEVNPNERYSAQNFFLAGLWFGRSKLNVSAFMLPFIKELQKLASDGINWWHSGRESFINTRVFVTHCVVDTVAKVKLLCMKQFNGRCSCYLCLNPGKPLPRKNSTIPQIRYSSEMEHDDRTNECIRKDMLEAHNENKTVRGMKGLSPLAPLKYFDLTYPVVIDYMHNQLIGVSKYLFEIWTKSSYHEKDFYLGPAKQKQIDKRIRALKSPSDISRDMKPVTSYSEWKANQWRAWLFFYGPLCLEGILPSRYYRHFCLLSASVYILNLEKVPRAQLRFVSENLKEFVRQFEAHYGLLHMTCNVHLTRHLVKCVIYNGPLWSYSLFVYEAGQAYTVQFVNGARGVAQQVARKYATFFNLPKILGIHRAVGEVALNYCNSIMTFTRFKKFSTVGEVTIVGNKFKHKICPSQNETILLTGKNMPTDNLFEVKKIIYAGSVFRTQVTSRKDDTVAQLTDGTFVKLVKFFIQEDTPDTIFAFVKGIVSEKKHFPTFNIHINICNAYMYQELSVINVKDIARKAILLSYDDSTYHIMILPNKFEKD